MNNTVKFSIILAGLALLLIDLVGCTPLSHSDTTDTHKTSPVAPNFPQAEKPEIFPPVVAKPEIVPPVVAKPEIVPPVVAKPDIYPDSSGYVTRGNASWNGLAAHGTKTASGQIYDLYGMTAAHSSLRLLTRVKVKNVSTGSSVVVTINDRLDDDDRVLIKLSYWAARRIGLVKKTSQSVEVRGLPPRIIH